MLEDCDMKEEMDSVWNHFRNIIGPKLQALHAPSSSQDTTLLEDCVGEILTVADAVKEKGKVGWVRRGVHNVY